jgi:hypothetical protein
MQVKFDGGPVSDNATNPDLTAWSVDNFPFADNTSGM